MNVELPDHVRHTAVGRRSVDRRAGRRGLWVAALLLGLFVLWTAVVRVGIAEGSRDSAWIVSPFGSWPDRVDHVAGTSDIQFSLFATYAAGATSNESEAPVVPAVGRPTIGSVVDSFDSDNINGSRFVTGVRAGRVTSLSVYVASPVDGAPNDRFEVAIYSDEHGAPLNRLAVSRVGTLRADAWNSAPIDATLEPETPYWFFYNTNGSSGDVNNAVYTHVPGTPVDEAVRSIRSAEFVRTAELLSSLGDAGPTTLAVLVLAGLVVVRRSGHALVYVAGFAVSLAIALAVRELSFEPFGRYPSGHALRTTYVVIVAAALVRRRSFDLAGGLIAAMVVFASVYSHGHYFEESLGGVLLAGAAAAAALSVAPVRSEELAQD